MISAAKLQKKTHVSVYFFTESVDYCTFLQNRVIKTALHKCILRANENTHNGCFRG